jgi:hypothetical protein
MIRRFSGVGFCAALAVGTSAVEMSAVETLARAAQAEAPAAVAPPMAVPAPLFSVDGGCPRLDTLSTAVTALIPHGDLSVLPRSTAVELADLGDSYRVQVEAEGVSRVRIFRDVRHDCQQRARFAAVFIVLTLLPPELVIDVQPPASPPSPPPLAAPPLAAPPEPPPRRYRLELGAVLDLAPPIFDAPQIIAWGGTLRAARWFGRWAGVVGVGVEPRAGFSKDGLLGREARVPLDLGLRLSRALGGWELDGEAGLAAAIFHAEGLNTLMPQAGTRLDLGARLGGILRFGRPSARAVPFLGLAALVFPRRYEIATTPLGTLGDTPALWLGATLGLSASL